MPTWGQNRKSSPPDLLDESDKEDEELSFNEGFSHANPLAMTQRHKVVRSEKLPLLVQEPIAVGANQVVDLKCHLSGLNCSGWSQSSGSLRNFLMLVMAMLPSGTTCPVGNVVWGKESGEKQNSKLNCAAYRLCNSMLDSWDSNNRNSLDLGCDICQTTL